MEENYGPSPHFKQRIIYHGPYHTIPHEVVFKTLDILTFESVLNLGYLHDVRPKISNLQSVLEDHQVTPIIERLEINLINSIENLVDIFLNFIFPQIKVHPFYLGQDQTYMQELSPGSQIVVANYERQSYLRWQKWIDRTKSQSVCIALLEQLVTVGIGEEGKEWRGMKYYRKEEFAALEMGVWKARNPVANLRVKYINESNKIQVQIRQFEGKKFKGGQLRYIEDDQICRYKEGHPLPQTIKEGSTSINSPSNH